MVVMIDKKKNVALVMEALDSSPRGRYRICVNSKSWDENAHDEYSRALSLVGEEERKRITKFLFRKDSKAALIGRLILHTLVCKTTGLNNSQLVWKRTDHGKPILDPSCIQGIPTGSISQFFSYNISHSGHWVVGASEMENPVGIDVNDYGLRPNCRIDFDADPDTDADENLPIVRKYFSGFKDVLSAPEAAYMKRIRFDSGEDQLVDFSRLWTLKESVTKLYGDGFDFGLSRLAFDFAHIPRKTIGIHPPSVSTLPIKISIDGIDKSAEWMFEQFKLDRYHIVSVAIHPRNAPDPSTPTHPPLHPLPVHYLTPTDLIQYLESMS